MIWLVRQELLFLRVLSRAFLNPVRNWRFFLGIWLPAFALESYLANIAYDLFDDAFFDAKGWVAWWSIGVLLVAMLVIATMIAIAWHRVVLLQSLSTREVFNRPPVFRYAGTLLAGAVLGYVVYTVAILVPLAIVDMDIYDLLMWRPENQLLDLLLITAENFVLDNGVAIIVQSVMIVFGMNAVGLATKLDKGWRNSWTFSLRALLPIFLSVFTLYLIVEMLRLSCSLVFFAWAPTDPSSGLSYLGRLNYVEIAASAALSILFLSLLTEWYREFLTAKAPT